MVSGVEGALRRVSLCAGARKEVLWERGAPLRCELR